MYNLYKKSCQNPLRVAAYLKATIIALEPVMQAADSHSTEDRELRELLRRMQWELDAALKAHTHDIAAQRAAGLITYEEYAVHVGQSIRSFEAMQSDLRSAI